MTNRFLIISIVWSFQTNYQNMSQLNSSEGILLGLGNPLLDISANVEIDFVKKHEMLLNSAIIATEKQNNLSKELTQKYKVEYFAGGSVLNSLRVFQWFHNKPLLSTFFGSIGDDMFGKELQTKAKADGVNGVYMIHKNASTGTCVCLITDNGKNRSLCANLGASKLLTKAHLIANKGYIEKAKVFYVSGFVLDSNPESVLHLAEHANSKYDKTFCLNLSAEFIVSKHLGKLIEVLKYTDILFANEMEAKKFANVMEWPNLKVKEIAGLMADLNTGYNSNKPIRKVIITRGKKKVVLAMTSDSDIKEYDVKQLNDNQIIDTNGAGDAFVGGFLSQFICNESIDNCINAGIYAAQEVVQHSGCNFPKENKYRK